MEEREEDINQLKEWVKEDEEELELQEDLMPGCEGVVDLKSGEVMDPKLVEELRHLLCLLLRMLQMHRWLLCHNNRKGSLAGDFDVGQDFSQQASV